jgi:biotin carboxyl carrier protein
MADLTARPAAGQPPEADAVPLDTGPTDGTGPQPTAPGGGRIDPRAVRASTAPSSSLGDEPTIRLSPPSEPLRMTNPTTGVGLLGGTVAGDDPPAASVLAQRQLLLDGEPIAATLEGQGGERYLLVEPDARTRVILGPGQAIAGAVHRREVIVDGFRFEIDVEPERIAALRQRASRGRAASAHSGPLEIRAIIPGRVVAVSISAGDAVTAGQQLLVVEAMKMQNELRAPRDGTVERVGVGQGVNIEVGDLLVVIS